MAAETPAPIILDDGYYGVRSEIVSDVRAAVEESSDREFSVLHSRFPNRLHRLDPMNDRQVRFLVQDFSGSSVVCVVRGRVARIISIPEYAQELRTPNGC